MTAAPVQEERPVTDNARTETPTLDTTDAAVDLMRALVAAGSPWVAVFWDRGWGDSGQVAEISIIEDGNGQNPRAFITADVYAALREAGTIEPNSLHTFKKRRIHDFAEQPKPEPTEAAKRPEAQALAAPQARAWMRAGFNATDFPIHVARVDDIGSTRQAMSVQVLAIGQGFIVNAYGHPTYLGAERLPLGEYGMGISIGLPHPQDQGWAEQARPLVENAVREALALLAAHSSGRVCASPHPDQSNEYGWKCERAAGHDQLDGWRGDHAMSAGHLWDTDGSRKR